jgi:4-hydroxybenzoate polyprenyltransferase
VAQAFLFLALQCLIGLVILLNLNTYSIVLGAASLLPITIYPFMKRITYWPQAALGLTFNWGALLGWTAVTGSLDVAPFILYFGAIFWTIGYDTIYAHQDKTDDAALGLKSSALRLGEKTKPALVIFYSITTLSLLATGYIVGMSGFYYLTIGFAIWHLYRQIRRTDIHNPARCLSVFRSNRDFGALVFGAILAGGLGSAPF